jgi:hypothetical protein
MNQPSIDVSIPLEALKSGRVAAALSELIASLAGGGSPKAVSPPKQVEESSVEAPAPKAKAIKRAAPAPDLSGSDTQRFERFVEGLPKLSQDFLALLEKKGKLTITEAVKALGIDAPKAMGGITGSITRWAPSRGVDVPYIAEKSRSGERTWRWVRGTGASPESGKRAGKKPRASAPISREYTTEDLVESAGGLARQFLLLLQSRRVLTRSEAVSQLGLDRPEAIGGVIGAIGRRASRRGIELPFEATQTENGERLWRWTAGAAPEAAEAPRAEPRNDAPTVRRRRPGGAAVPLTSAPEA